MDIINSSFKCENSKWIQTDDNQWLLHENGAYAVIEIQEIIDYHRVTFVDIVLENYTEEEIQEVLKQYGYKSRKEIPDQLVAECLAESELCPYVFYKGTYEDCLKYVKEHIA